VDEGAVSRNANDVLMLRAQLKSLGEHTVIVNKTADDDAGDAHNLIAQFDSCGLSDHHREGTRVQNRRNVQVGSRDNQQKPPSHRQGWFLVSHTSWSGWVDFISRDSES
jgi:hypothetical protein